MKIARRIILSSILPLILWSLGILSCLAFYRASMAEVDLFFNDAFRRHTLISDIYFHLGFNHGIHAFKNFVLRGNLRGYQENAYASLTEAKTKIDEYLHIPNISSEESEALLIIKDTVSKFLQNLEIIAKMKAAGAAVEDIDRAVLVEDDPASIALKACQEKINLAQEKSIRRIHQSYVRAITLTAFIFVLSFAFALIASRRLSKGVLSSLKKLTEISKPLTEGSFAYHSQDFSDIEADEIKSVALLLDEMSKNLSTMVLGLKKSNEDLEHFSYVAAHDLQEPTRKISNFAHLIDAECGSALPADGRMYLQKIIASSEKMTSMIRSLLEYSRLAGLSLNREILDFKTVVKAAIEQNELSLTDAQSTIEYSDLPQVVGDRNLLTIVMSNLISNAIKFRREAHAPLIKIYAARKSAGLWQLYVEDNGIGLDVAYSQKAFRPFGRLVSRESYPGYGIGLAICKRILASHNTELEVTSVIGSGSTFSFYLEAANKKLDAA